MGTAYFKLIHVLAVIIFLGNIITGLFWMRIAVKTKDLRIIHHTMNGIIMADRYFTIPGVIVITVGRIYGCYLRTFSYTANGMDIMVVSFYFQFPDLRLHSKSPRFKEKFTNSLSGDGKFRRL